MNSYNTSEMDELKELFDEGLGTWLLVQKIKFFGQDCIFVDEDFGGCHRCCIREGFWKRNRNVTNRRWFQRWC